MKDPRFKNPPTEFLPDVRWWLAEGLHTDQTLIHDLDLLKEAGFGAIEFLAMDDSGAPDAIYGWGSEEWMHDSQLLFEEATKRDMGVSTTCGTNWSNCNLPSITPDDKAAAKELDYSLEIVRAGNSREGKIRKCVLRNPNVTKQELIDVIAIKNLGIKEDGHRYLDKDSAIVLTDKIVDGKLSFTAPEDGDYFVFYFYLHGTGQTAGPSAGVSYTINYFDRYGIEAFKEYWDREVITAELDKTIKKNGRCMMYMDSLELSTFSRGGQLWGYTFMEEFRKRRGYSLSPFLPFVPKRKSGHAGEYNYKYHMADSVFFKKLHNDLYQTMTEMYMENMMKPMKEWCNCHNMWLRSEISYGLPFEISLPGKYVDDVETESLEFASQIDSYRGLAGTAHVYNRLFSSETGATLENYKLPLNFYNQIIYTQFAAGVTKTVLHGYSSIAGSEEATCWPGHEGMWPIFAERFGSRQPAFRHYKDWTKMISRYQMMLRRGIPRVDLAILRLDYAFNNTIFCEAFTKEEEDIYEKMYMRNHEAFYWKDMRLQDAGYNWDYLAPQILEEDFVDFSDGLLMPDGPGYKALIIYQDSLPYFSALKILEMAKKGLPVVIVNGCTEDLSLDIQKVYKKAAAMTPFNDMNDDALAIVMDKMRALPNVFETDDQAAVMDILKCHGILPRTEFVQQNRNILTLTRKDSDKNIVYIYNMMYGEKEPSTITMRIEGSGKPYYYNCTTGDITEVGCYDHLGNTTILTLSVNPGEARLYLIDESEEGVHANDSNMDITVNIPPIDLKVWELEVEDWNEGNKVEIFENRGLGITTKEVFYETEKKILKAGNVELIPWKDIPAIGPEVSGVGYYHTTFILPDAWNKTIETMLSIESTNGSTVCVYVNDIKAPALDISRLCTEITELVHPGENTILVEVSSTLANRLQARGYYSSLMQRTFSSMRTAGNAVLDEENKVKTLEAEPEDGEIIDDNEKEESSMGALFKKDFTITPRDYGMVGHVKITFSQKVHISPVNGRKTL